MQRSKKNVPYVGVVVFIFASYSTYISSYYYIGVTDAIHVIYAWGVGMVDSVLPENVGVELGGFAPDALRYGMLEMHYDNPDHVEGLIDHSGFRMYYTPNLRPINAGIMTIGHQFDERHFIPEGLTTVNYGYCMKDCTEIGLPPDGVTVFGTFLHAHPIGTALIVRHVRNGVELEPIEADWAYDFDYQQMIAVDNVHVLPGDDLILECHYTNYRNRTTFGGIETSTEMCLAFLWVYPKPDLKTCVTTFAEDDLSQWATGAKDKGYLNQDADILNYAAHYKYKHEIPFNYDITKEGATEYYNNLWLPNDTVIANGGYHATGRQLMCFDKDGDTIWQDGTTYYDHMGDIPQFEARGVKDNEICYGNGYYTELDVATGSTNNTGSDDNSGLIIGVVIAAVLLVLIIVVGVLVYRSSKNKKVNGGNVSNYEKVEATNMASNA